MVGLSLCILNSLVSLSLCILNSLISLSLCTLNDSLASLNSVVYSALSSIDSIVYSTFHCILSAFNSVCRSILSSINRSARQGSNLIDDRGQRSNVDVEALQSLCILLNESLDLCSILAHLLNVASVDELAQLSLNGLESVCDNGCVTTLEFFCESAYDSFGSCLFEVEVFSYLVTGAACQTHYSNCCHCK